MGRAPCCDKTKVKRGPWSPEEDSILRSYVEKYGTGGNWIALPHKAGLKRCGKSCRLRWLNYLRPDIKHGEFSEEEDKVIISLYRNIGSRWSVIASQLPGRTDNDVKNYWNTKLKKKLLAGSTSLSSTLVNNTTTTNPINFAGEPINFGLQAPPPATLTKHQTKYYGNSSPSIASSDTLAPYQMDMINSHSTELVSEIFYNESFDSLPLPRLMEVQENGTTYNNGFTTSSSQEISSLSPSYSLGTSTYAGSNWSDNTVGEEVGFLMELGSKPSNYALLNGFDYQNQKLTGAEEIDITTATRNLANYSYSSTSSF